MSITIEKARPTDAAEILEYLKKIGSESDNVTFGAEGLPFSIEDEANYISSLENSRDGIMLVARQNGKIVGNSTLNRLPRRMGHRGDFGISVLKEYWNRGIGGALMREIINFARECDFEIIDLTVRSDNASAIHLYEKYGFYKLFTYSKFTKIDDRYADCDYMRLDIKQKRKTAIERCSKGQFFSNTVYLERGMPYLRLWIQMQCFLCLN